MEKRDAERLHGLITDQRLKGGTEAYTQQTQRWSVQSRRALREKFGPLAAEKMQGDIDTFIEARPALAQRLL